MFRRIIWADILQDVNVVFHLYILFLEIIWGDISSKSFYFWQ